MLNNSLLKLDNSIIRVLQTDGNKYLIIECTKKSMPKWVNEKLISDYHTANDNNEYLSLNLSPLQQKIVNERFNLIAPILPFIGDKAERCLIINQICNDKNINRQTICTYLWKYLSTQNINSLLPAKHEKRNCLTTHEKNYRWALNKYYYTKYKNSLKTAYTFMLKEKYRDTNGNLLEGYPSFYQFRYFFRKYDKKEKNIITRNGLKFYQRNERPLLGNGIQEYATTIGYGMLDATVCDIYLINDSGQLVGRPILTVCIDAYSGLCCGYALTWEGGVYSLRKLMLNIITDKVEHCKSFGIIINNTDWDCSQMPAELISDMGKEYTSSTFAQITDLGVTLTNLPPYRPELKGAVEKFFDVIQNLFKPSLKGKGVIEKDYQERGAHDYRKDASLTMNDFEKVIIHCILFYNAKRIINNFPFTKAMINKGVKPYSSNIWNYSLNQNANLINVDKTDLVKILLPRTVGRFVRKGLIVNKLRYKNESFTEMYLTGGKAMVAYNPEDITYVWLIKDGMYIQFEIIDIKFRNKSLQDTKIFDNDKKSLINSCQAESMQARIELMEHIEIIRNLSNKGTDAKIKNIRENRQKEKNRTHIDYVKDDDNVL